MINVIKVFISKGLFIIIIFELFCCLEYEISIGKDGKKIGLVIYCLLVFFGKFRIVV